MEYFYENLVADEDRWDQFASDDEVPDYLPGLKIKGDKRKLNKFCYLAIWLAQNSGCSEEEKKTILNPNFPLFVFLLNTYDLKEISNYLNSEIQLKSLKLLDEENKVLTETIQSHKDQLNKLQIYNSNYLKENFNLKQENQFLRETVEGVKIHFTTLLKKKEIKIDDLLIEKHMLNLNFEALRELNRSLSNEITELKTLTNQGNAEELRQEIDILKLKEKEIKSF